MTSLCNCITANTTWWWSKSFAEHDNDAADDGVIDGVDADVDADTEAVTPATDVKTMKMHVTVLVLDGLDILMLSCLYVRDCHYCIWTLCHLPWLQTPTNVNWIVFLDVSFGFSPVSHISGNR